MGFRRKNYYLLLHLDHELILDSFYQKFLFSLFITETDHNNMICLVNEKIEH